MKHVIAAAAVLLSTGALAQEIGKELPPESPPPTTAPAPGTTYDNPYAPPPAPPPPPKEEAPPAPAAPGPRRGKLGIRSGFTSAGVPSAPAPSTPGTPAASGAASPTIGLKFLVTDKLGVNLDFGAAMVFGSTVPFGFGLGLGVDAYLGSPSKPIRGVVTAGLGFGKLVSTLGDDFNMDISVGGGAEYWLNDHFSLSGKALIALPINLKGNVVVRVATVSPALGATFYF